VDPHPKGRHKRFSVETISRLEAFAQGTPAEVLLQALIAAGADVLKNVIFRSNLDASSAEKAVQELASTGQMINLENGASEPVFTPESLVMSKGAWERLAGQLVHELKNYHSSFPLRSGMPREELKSRMKSFSRPSARLFNAIVHKLVSESALEEAGPLVRLPGYQVRFSPQQEQVIEKLMRRFTAAPYAPPTVKDCQAEVGEEVLAALLELGYLVQTGPDVVFRKEDYEKMVSEISDLLKKNHTITAAQVRDHFNTSRRYALALLEHLDASGITAREGDTRRLK
jgi:selenocysteine-specific elongation factor